MKFYESVFPYKMTSRSDGALFDESLFDSSFTWDSFSYDELIVSDIVDDVYLTRESASNNKGRSVSSSPFLSVTGSDQDGTSFLVQLGWFKMAFKMA